MGWNASSETGCMFDGLRGNTYPEIADNFAISSPKWAQSVPHFLHCNASLNGSLDVSEFYAAHLKTTYARLGDDYACYSFPTACA